MYARPLLIVPGSKGMYNLCVRWCERICSLSRCMLVFVCVCSGAYLRVQWRYLGCASSNNLNTHCCEYQIKSTNERVMNAVNHRADHPVHEAVTRPSFAPFKTHINLHHLFSSRTHADTPIPRWFLGTLRAEEYCTICGEKGHRQFECPNRNRTS